MAVTTRKPAVGMADAARRALADLAQPRIMLISLLPLLLAGLMLGLLAWWGWGGGVQTLRAWIDEAGWMRAANETVASMGAGMGLDWLPALLAQFALFIVVVPTVLILSLLIMASLATPWIAGFVRDRRFPALGTAPPVSMWRALWWSLGSVWLALGLFAITMPLWLIPPLGLILPSLIGGWLTYRVMAFDILSGMATNEERQRLLRQHRLTLLVMGMACGYMSAMPAAVWMFGLFWNMLIGPVLLVASMWVYMLVFCYSSLWFAHFLLAALQEARGKHPGNQEAT